MLILIYISYNKVTTTLLNAKTPYISVPITVTYSLFPWLPNNSGFDWDGLSFFQMTTPRFYKWRIFIAFICHLREANHPYIVEHRSFHTALHFTRLFQPLPLDNNVISYNNKCHGNLTLCVHVLGFMVRGRYTFALLLNLVKNQKANAKVA